MSEPTVIHRRAALALIGGGTVALAVGAPAIAQGTDQEATDIIRQLAPTADQSISTVEPGTAVIRRRKKPVTVKVASPEEAPVTVVIDRGHALDFDVYFEFDSDRLTPEARRRLRALGVALASPELSDYRFLVAGHTDAKGTADYNAALSARRARSVRRFLIETFAIRPRRLYTAGFGETQLRDPANPTAGINRRVEVALIAE